MTETLAPKLSAFAKAKNLFWKLDQLLFSDKFLPPDICNSFFRHNESGKLL